MKTTSRIPFKVNVLTLAFALNLGMTSSAQESSSKIPSYLSISGFVNNQYTYESQQNNDGSYTEVNTLNIRRARLDLKGSLNEHLEFRLQADFAGSPKIVDAYIKYKFSKLVNVELGQFKTPFTLENQYSPLNLESIENAQVIGCLSGYSDILGGKRNNGRDIGVVLYGDLLSSSDGSFPLVSYNIGVFNGSGINTKDENLTKDIIGRLDFHPFIKELVLSASAVKGTYNDGTDSNAGNNRYSFGGEYKDKSLTLRSEYVSADYQNGGTWQQADGLYVVAGYWFKFSNGQKLSPVLRYDHFNLNDVNSNQYLVGVDWWPESHLRLQLNYTVSDLEQFDKKGNIITAMVSVKF